MAEKKVKAASATETSAQEPKKYTNSYSAIIERFNAIMSAYGGMGVKSMYQAFSRAGLGMANLTPIQNQRVKALNPLPADYSKDDLNEFLRTPATSERQLREIAEGLKWTTYSFFKLQKSYSDMLTYRHYVKPLYIESESGKTQEFMREWRLVDKIEKKFGFEDLGRKASGQALNQGKVFYITRSSIDKVHNKVNYIFHQELPSQWCQIIGFNNISGYTISFDMMYFLQPGTDYTQYGDLFEPFVQDFFSVFMEPERAKPNYIYASKNEVPIKIGNRTAIAHLERVNKKGAGQPRMFMQNGRWCYYVSLPINRVWTFEIDNTTAIVASPFAGLFQTFAQQADYEAAQLSLIMNPLIKIFTGEIPYTNSDDATINDNYKLSVGGRAMFEAFFNALMAATHTGGTAMYSAPFENIKSHDYPESSNANAVSSSFLQYGMEKTGVQALVPINEAPHQGVAEYSAKLESRFADGVYSTLRKMFNYLISQLNLKYEWDAKLFGSVYLDDLIRANALKQLDKGDLSQHFILAALDGVSVLDRLSMSKVIKGSGLLELLMPPATSYTMSNSGAQTKTGDHNSGSTASGRPTKTETEVAETKQEKQTEGEAED